MIFDRKKSDVDNSKTLILNKVQKNISLSDEEINTLEKGTLTINTLNRIENKQSELFSLLSEIGYYVPQIVTKTWTYDDLFTCDEFERIVKNTETLRKASLIYKNTPITPIADYYFENLNAIEKILYDIENMTSEIKSLFLECGTFECGEV